VLRSISGKLMVDGIQRSSGGPSNYSGQMGELAGSFVDVRANTVSGGITVLRQARPTVADDPEWEES
jgi:hypothetical protein